MKLLGRRSAPRRGLAVSTRYFRAPPRSLARVFPSYVPAVVLCVGELPPSLPLRSSPRSPAIGEYFWAVCANNLMKKLGRRVPLVLAMGLNVRCEIFSKEVYSFRNRRGRVLRVVEIKLRTAHDPEELEMAD